MRNKFLSLCLVASFMASPVKAGPLCPYHWYLAIAGWASVMITLDGIAQNSPQYRSRVKLAKLAATAVPLAFLGKHIYEKISNQSAQKSEN